MIKLKRLYVVLISLLLLACVHFGLCLYDLIGKETIDGKIINYHYWTTRHKNTTIKHLAPIASYTVDNIEYQLEGPEVIDPEGSHKTGIDVPILYSKRAPNYAYFYTLSGFWFSNYIFWLIAILIIVIALTTFIEKSQFLIFRYSRSAEGSLFELTPSEKPNWIKRNVGKVKLHSRDELAKRQSFRNRRR